MFSLPGCASVMRTVRGAMASTRSPCRTGGTAAPFGHKFVEGEGDIAGGNRAAIMKAGVRIEGYLHP
jgi:hypothetical protein